MSTVKAIVPAAKEYTFENFREILEQEQIQTEANAPIFTFVIRTSRGYFRAPFSIGGVHIGGKWNATVQDASHFESEELARRCIHQNMINNIYIERKTITAAGCN